MQVHTAATSRSLVHQSARPASRARRHFRATYAATGWPRPTYWTPPSLESPRRRAGVSRVGPPKFLDFSRA
jgi:hypothetical protein